MYQIVVPVFNAEKTLRASLKGLINAGADARDVIVVDDGSSDKSLEIASQFGVEIIKSPRNVGAAAARNLGLNAARAPWVVFVDADVVIAPDALERMKAVMQRNTSPAAVFGSYDDHPNNPGLVGRYRNLLHHFVHHENAGIAHTFWTGCGMVKRETALSVGGFDESLHAMEDVDFGRRLSAAGHHIVLDPAIQGNHRKNWSLISMIHCDIFNRARPWAKMILASGNVDNELNISWRHRLATLSALVFVLSLVTATVAPSALLGAQLAGFAFVALNVRFFLFLLSRHGVVMALCAVPLQLIHYLCAGLGFAIALGDHIAGRNRRRSLTLRSS